MNNHVRYLIKVCKSKKKILKRLDKLKIHFTWRNKCNIGYCIIDYSIFTLYILCN